MARAARSVTRNREARWSIVEACSIVGSGFGSAIVPEWFMSATWEVQKVIMKGMLCSSRCIATEQRCCSVAAANALRRADCVDIDVGADPAAGGRGVVVDTVSTGCLRVVRTADSS